MPEKRLPRGYITCIFCNLTVMSKAYPEGWTVLGPFRKLSQRHVGCCKDCYADLLKGSGLVHPEDEAKAAVDALTRETH
jgi:hypothetical protein